MGVYVHKSVLELADLTNREKLVLAYFFNLKIKKINLSNKEIALALNFSDVEIKKIVLSLKNKKYISLVGNTSNREIRLKKFEMKFAKATFNGFNLDDDILKLDLNITKKFILAEIRSLINSKNGKCTASNLHIANLLNLKERAIRTALCDLEQNGFLKRILKNINGKTERKIILNLTVVSDEVVEEKKEDNVKQKVKVEEKYNDEVLAIFESFPKRPMMTDLKIEEQKSLCLPILKSKSKDELEFIKFVINFNSKNNESWKAGFMPYMYKFLEVDKEKYFNEAIKSEFDKFRNKPKVNANLQLLNLQLERDLFTFFSEIEESVWELSDFDILEEFKIRYINGYLKFSEVDFNKMALQKIKEYRPSNLNF